LTPGQKVSLPAQTPKFYEKTVVNDLNTFYEEGEEYIGTLYAYPSQKSNDRAARANYYRIFKNKDEEIFGVRFRFVSKACRLVLSAKTSDEINKTFSKYDSEIKAIMIMMN
jgi:hypothetical protein